MLREREPSIQCASAGVIQQAICVWCCVRALAWGYCFFVGQPFVFYNFTLFTYVIFISLIDIHLPHIIQQLNNTFVWDL